MDSQFTYCFTEGKPETLVLLKNPKDMPQLIFYPPQDYIFAWVGRKHIINNRDAHEQIQQMLEQKIYHYQTVEQAIQQLGKGRPQVAICIISISLFQEWKKLNNLEKVKTLYFYSETDNHEDLKEHIRPLKYKLDLECNNSNNDQEQDGPSEEDPSQVQQEQEKAKQWASRIYSDKYKLSKRLSKYRGKSQSRAKVLPNFIFLNSEIITSHSLVRTLHSLLNQKIDHQTKMQINEALRNLIQHIQQIRVDMKIIKEEKQRLIQFINCEKTNSEGNSENQDKIVKWYTEQTFFSQLVNNLLSHRSPTQIFYVQPYVKLLFTILKELYIEQSKERKEGFKCYRGGKMDQKEFEVFSKNQGQIIQNPSFLSTSLDQKVAERFFKEKGDTFFEIQVQQFNWGSSHFGYANISKFNRFKEQQILFNPLNTFEVIQAKKDHNQNKYIKLKYRLFDEPENINIKCRVFKETQKNNVKHQLDENQQQKVQTWKHISELQREEKILNICQGNALSNEYYKLEGSSDYWGKYIQMIDENIKLQRGDRIILKFQKAFGQFNRNYNEVINQRQTDENQISSSFNVLMSYFGNKDKIVRSYQNFMSKTGYPGWNCQNSCLTEEELKKVYELDQYHFFKNVTFDSISFMDKKKYKISETINLKNRGLKDDSLKERYGHVMNHRIKSIDLSYNFLIKFPYSATSNLRQLQYLNISDNKINQLMNSIGDLENLRTLIVSNNHLVDFPQSFSSMKKLRVLKANFNSIKCIKNITKNEALVEIDLYYNNIVELPQTMEKLVMLEQLNLRSNKIRLIMMKMSKLKILRNIDLSENEIKEFSNQIQIFKKQEINVSLIEKIINTKEKKAQLKNRFNMPKQQIQERDSLKNINKINFGFNKISLLNIKINIISNIKQLNLESNLLRTLPYQMVMMNELKKIILRKNKFAYVPNIIKSINSIIEIDLSHNRIQFLPEGFENLENLIICNLNNNPLSSRFKTMFGLQDIDKINISEVYNSKLPDLRKIKQLTLTSNPKITNQLDRDYSSLTLSFTHLSKVPTSIIYQLIDLVELNLSYNQLKDLPRDLSIYLIQLSILNLSQNCFEEVPEVVYKIWTLQQLDLSHNRIKYLSEQLDKLNNLSTLNLSQNCFEEVPEVVYKLSRLKQLDLSHNRINYLSEQLDKLNNLSTLNLSQNYFEEVPEVVYKLSRLKQLDLSHNRINYLSEQLDKLNNLSTLNLSQNCFEEVPEVIYRLWTLQQLDLSHNFIQFLPEGFENLENLIICNLNNNPLSSRFKTMFGLQDIDKINISEVYNSKLPDLRKIKQLTLTSNPKITNQLDQDYSSLTLSFTHLSKVPTSIIYQLIDLVVLNLSYNQLKDLPRDLYIYLIQLSILNLSQNCFEEVPVVVYKLWTLQQLDLSHNRIKYLSEQLDKLNNLSTLNLSQNCFEEVPEVVYKLSRLKQLDLSHNRINYLSEQLDKLNNLSTLNLSQNCFEEVPVVVYKLSRLKQLDLSHNRINYLSEQLDKLNNLSTLNLSQNYFEEVPEVVYKLSRLKQLDLSHNRINYLSEQLDKLNNLSTLNLSQNCFEEVPVVVYKLWTLQKLDLSHNRIKYLSEQLDKLNNLSTLNLSQNCFEEVPEVVYKLSRLKQLDLSHNRIKYLSEQLDKLNNLSTLNLSQNCFEEVPEVIYRLWTLQQLDLSHNFIQFLPEGFENLENLIICNLYNNPLSSLFKTMFGLQDIDKINISEVYNSKLPDLRKIKQLTLTSNPKITNQLDRDYSSLTLSFTHLSKVPTSIIYQLIDLVVLNLSYNQLKDLPRDLHRQLRQLSILNLSQNCFEEVPVVVYKLSRLKQLDLSHNRINYLSEQLDKLNNLSTLNLSQNCFEEVPEVVYKLSRLKQLDLSHNRINYLSEQLDKLNNLSTLNLSQNCFEEVPEVIYRLWTLQQLDLSHNFIQFLPEGFENLENLIICNLYNNPLSSLFKTMFGLQDIDKINISEVYNSKFPFLRKIKQLTLTSNPKITNQLDQDYSSLTLSFTHLSKVPTSIIYQLIDLVVLNLSYNQLKDLPRDLYIYLIQLSILNLSQNCFEEVPVVVYKLWTLQQLDLSHNRIKYLSEQLDKLNNLSTLNLSQNCFEEVPEVIYRLWTLQQLDLSHNFIQFLPEDFENLENLNICNLYNNPLSSLFKTMFGLQDIDKINISEVYNSKLPDLRKIKQLTLTSNPKITNQLDRDYSSLTLSFTHLSKVPTSIIYQLIDLVVLNLSYNQLKDLPRDLNRQLRQLSILNLSQNCFEEVPVVVYKLSRLQQLDLSHNFIQFLPEGFEYLENLIICNLNNNPLSSRFKTMFGLQDIDKINISEVYNSKLPDLRKIKQLTLTSNPKITNQLDRDYSSLTLSFTHLSKVPTSIIYQLIDLVVLNLSYNQLKDLPRDLHRQLRQLSILNLSQNCFEEVPVVVYKLSRLKQLDLSHNRIKYLSEQLDKLNNLSTLNLSQNCFEEVPVVVYKLSRLKQLDLSHNFIQFLPEDFENLENLIICNLNNNPLSSRFKTMFGLQDIDKINISEVYNSKLPDLRKIKQLTLTSNPKITNQLDRDYSSLTLSFTHLSKVPTSIIYQLIDLVVLNLSYNQLKDLPRDLYIYLIQLSILNLSQNCFEEVPVVVYKLWTLQQLDLSHNRIKYLSEQLDKLNNLSTLNLSQNCFEEVPEVVYKLSRLKQLDLSHNRIKYLSEQLDKLNNLSTLNLSQNCFEEVPEVVYKLSRLKQLDLSHNRIKYLSGQLDKLNNLSTLNLSQNCFEEVPVVVYKLWTLQKLDLSHNRIKYLSEQLDKLNNLSTLNLSQNCFEEVPEVIYRLWTLQQLDLSHNFIQCLSDGFEKLINISRCNLNNNPLSSRFKTMFGLQDIDNINWEVYETQSYKLRLIKELTLTSNPKITNQLDKHYIFLQLSFTHINKVPPNFIYQFFNLVVLNLSFQFFPFSQYPLLSYPKANINKFNYLYHQFYLLMPIFPSTLNLTKNPLSITKTDHLNFLLSNKQEQALDYQMATFYFFINQPFDKSTVIQHCSYFSQFIQQIYKAQYQKIHYKFDFQELSQKLINGFTKLQNMQQQIQYWWSQDDFQYFQIINKLMRSCSSPSQIFLIQPFVRMLFNTVKQLYIKQRQQKHRNGFTCFRCGTISREQLMFFQQNKGQIIQNIFFLSTVLDFSIAQQYQGNVLFIIQIQNNNELSEFGFADISFFPSYKQIVFNPFNYFQIIDAFQSKEGYYEIRLRYNPQKQNVQKLRMFRQLSGSLGNAFHNRQQSLQYWQKYIQIVNTVLKQSESYNKIYLLYLQKAFGLFNKNCCLPQNRLRGNQLQQQIRECFIILQSLLGDSDYIVYKFKKWLNLEIILQKKTAEPILTKEQLIELKQRPEYRFFNQLDLQRIPNQIRKHIQNKEYVNCLQNKDSEDSIFKSNDWIQKLPKLQHINLTNMSYTKIPNLLIFQKLIINPNSQNKTECDLKRKIITLSARAVNIKPQGLNKLINIDKLDFSNNHFLCFSELITIYLSKIIKKVTEIRLRMNDLTQFPKDILKMGNLRKLDLSFNRIQKLPNVIPQNLTNLQQFDISNNELKQLPQQIFKIENMKILRLQNNQISTIPEGISALKNLMQFDISGNNLTSLPEQIQDLRKLQQLCIKDFQLSKMVQEKNKLSLKRNEDKI